jgi:hypothetical protein
MGRSLRVSCFALAVALAASTSAPSAHADAYGAAMAQGVVARDRAEETSDPKAWDEALRAFQEADRIHPTKEARYELGYAAMHLHAEDLACEAFEGAIELGLSGKAKDKADAFLAINVPLMARLTVVGPAGSHIIVQGRERGVLPLPHPIVVFAGELRARLIAPDGRTREKDVMAKAGAVVALDLTPAKPLPPVDGGSGASTGRSKTFEWILISSGSVLFTGGVVTFFIANGSVARRREDLARVCAVRDGDECAKAADVALQSAAQSDVDAIATAKTLRVVGLAAAGLGAAAAIFGTVRLVTSPRETAATMQPTAIALPGGGMFLGVNGAF